MERGEMFEVVKHNIHAIIEGAREGEINERHSMRDFGADSLEMVEVVSRSMKQLKVKVRRTELGKAKNLGDLLDLFESSTKKA